MAIKREVLIQKKDYLREEFGWVVKREKHLEHTYDSGYIYNNCTLVTYVREVDSAILYKLKPCEWYCRFYRWFKLLRPFWHIVIWFTLWMLVGEIWFGALKNLIQVNSKNYRQVVTMPVVYSFYVTITAYIVIGVFALKKIDKLFKARAKRLLEHPSNCTSN